jgi:hypothetical protein
VMKKKMTLQRNNMRLSAAILSCYGLLISVCSAAPTISKVVPAGAMRGSECEVLVMGANLHEPQVLFF